MKARRRCSRSHTLYRLTGRVPAFLIPSKYDRAPFFRFRRLVKIREECARGGVPFRTLTNRLAAPRDSRSERFRQSLPYIFWPIEKLPVRGTNLIIFINRRSGDEARQQGATGSEGEG